MNRPSLSQAKLGAADDRGAFERQSSTTPSGRLPSQTESRAAVGKARNTAAGVFSAAATSGASPAIAGRPLPDAALDVVVQIRRAVADTCA